MRNQDINLRRAIHHLRESALALQKTVQQRRALRESDVVQKPDGSRVTPTDLYNAVNQMTPAYGGAIGAALRNAIQPLFQASQAFIAQQQTAAKPAAPAAPVPGAAPAAPAAAATESFRPRRR